MSKAQRSRTSFLLVAAFAGFVLVLLASKAWPAVREFRANDLTVNYPGDWTLHDQIPASTGLGSTWAVLGTLAWGPCRGSDINCHYQQRLQPGEIEVEVGMRGALGTNGICDWAKAVVEQPPRTDGIAETRTYTRILGRPAIRTDSVVNSADYYRSDGWREWLIAFPESTVSAYYVAAKWRGPGDAALLADLDQLIASLQFPPSSQSGAADCGAPFPPT